jgi:phage-related tail fiber protein
MLMYGVTVAEGSEISNLTVATGTAFPANPSIGELFFRTDLNALHIYNNSAWVKTVDASVFIPNSAITAGTHTSITYDTKGLVTGGTSPTTLAGYGITDATTLISATPGTYRSVTINAQGLVTGGTNPSFAAVGANNDITSLTALSTVPTVVQNSLLGVSQTWQNVTRALATPYTNSTGKPIQLHVSYSVPTVSTNYTLQITVGGVIADFIGHFHGVAGGNHYIGVTAIIPAGATYQVDATGANLALAYCTELR